MITNHGKLKIYSVEVFNLMCTGMICGEIVPKGSLGVTVSRLPENELYTKTGDVYWRCVDGIVSCYHQVPGSTEGFAGRTITLKVAVKSNVFSRRTGYVVEQHKGDLWDSGKAMRVAAEQIGQKIYGIGLRYPRENIYCHFCVTQEFIDRISKVVILGEAKQSPEL